ncbi:hypothetical protein BKA67DRAFT_536893 [Truncatella angustata]|uniref:Uncharacterized protein n=1 Tax=Truncatella angustata TaxID=152316 RepID=A0A9P8UJ74_9PEZI|nr:uncharacterized protein BKA67DRAFT_536893 [Truncatella angustata]KAH6653200.1 hypothetical protein BKA67DRAFT_536893 [Truncatella angustata]KAH8196754.1 hypothetical protein TruAng_009073 [Truncatella angustata]
MVGSVATDFTGQSIRPPAILKMSTRMAITISKASKARPLGLMHIQCRVKPGVNKNREGVSSLTADAVELNVAAPPREGEANKAVIRVMSEALNIPKSEIVISSGLKSRDKTIEISPSTLGLSEAQNKDQWPALVKDILIKHIAQST